MWRQASVLTVLLLVSASLMPTRAQQPAAVPVGTVAAELRPITQSTEFVGRVEAIDRVDVRARVTGFLQKMLFKEGDMVKEGQALYEIEPDTYKAAEMQARGALIQAQAKFANATAQRARTEELVKTNTAAQATLDQRIAEEKSAQGDIVSSDANSENGADQSRLYGDRCPHHRRGEVIQIYGGKSCRS